MPGLMGDARFVTRFCVALVVIAGGCHSEGSGTSPSRTTPVDSISPGDVISSARENSLDASAPDASAPDAGAPGAIASQRPDARRLTVAPLFRDVAADAGIRFTFYTDAVPERYFLPEVMGGGAAWIDYDNDGSLDLFFANGCRLQDPDPSQMEHISRFYRQLATGQFKEQALASGGWHNGYGQGCAVGDYDADGFADLFLANYGPDVLFHNNGDGTFSKVTATAGTSDDDWSSSAAWFDADGDGDLDLYVVNYMDVSFATHKVCQYENGPGYCGPGSFRGVADRLYLSRGDGTFAEEGAAMGMTAVAGKGLAIAVVDFDHDLRAEVYVANDMEANFLFARGGGAAEESADQPKRLGSGYIEIAEASGCATSGEGLNEASMGVACADFDRDSYCDIFVTHFYHAKNTLYRNLGSLSFVDDSFHSRTAACSHESLGFGTIPLDFDRDGAFDLFVANGHVLGARQSPSAMRPQLLHNDGQGRFFDVSHGAGSYFDELMLGRGVAGGDFDNDGDVDIAVTHLDRPVALLQNDTPASGHFIGFDLRTWDRVPAVGGRVIVHRPAEPHLTQPIQVGGSYLSSPDARLLFGLGDSTDPVNIEIRWADGSIDRWQGLSIDRYWRVFPGQPPQAYGRPIEDSER